MNDRPKRILVIEDDDEARMMYVLLLGRWGYDVTEAANGTEGIRLARERRPDLILLDVMMPDMDGYTVCKELRSDKAFQVIPIIFLTALDSIDDRVKAYMMGGDDYLTKGRTGYKELQIRIKAALNRTERIKEMAADQRSEAAKESLTIGVLSLCGGVGVSTLALNLAHQSALQDTRRTMLLDLALPVGSIGLWTGMTGERHLVKLLSRAPGEVDLATIDNFSTQHVHDFFFIPTARELMNTDEIRVDTLQRIIDLLRAEEYTTVLDLGRGTLPLQWRTPALCDWVVVVTSNHQKSRELANISLNSLPDYGVDQRSLILVFNDVNNAKPKDISADLVRPPDVFIQHHPDLQELPTPSPVTRLWALITNTTPKKTPA
jgi:CheY-like chemotaxis protein/MinD-like ATPase involved in chromosome partitioning or flagellar assembly